MARSYLKYLHHKFHIKEFRENISIVRGKTENIPKNLMPKENHSMLESRMPFI
jgi:hypothetical protein